MVEERTIIFVSEEILWVMVAVGQGKKDTAK